MNFEALNNKQVIKAARDLGIVHNYSHSCGGGRDDPNRDHQAWYIEIVDQGEWRQEFVAYCGGSGRSDGKAYCERLARRIVLERAITDREFKQRHNVS